MQTILVFSDDRQLVSALRALRPAEHLAVVTEEDSAVEATVVVVDRGLDADAGLTDFLLEGGSLVVRGTREMPLLEGRRRIDLPEETPAESVAAIVSLVLDCAGAETERDLLEIEVQVLGELHALLSSGDVEAFHARIIRAVTDVLGVGSGYLLLKDSSGGKYQRHFVDDPRPANGAGYVPILSREEVDGFLASGDRWAVIEREWTDLEGRSRSGRFLLLPIRSRLGALGCAKIPLRSEDDEALDRGRVEAAERLLEEVGTVVQNQRSLDETRELTIRDDLTKAYNRRYFESFVDEEIERARRYSGVFSLIFLDLDDLKSVNNRHGHLIGSRVLQEVGKRIIGAVRGIDKVVRFGGDEFCVILPQTSEERASGVADRIRKEISGAPYLLGPGVVVEMTASFGIASYPHHATTKENLVRAADGAMYQVKDVGKNSIRVATVAPDEAAGHQGDRVEVE